MDLNSLFQEILSGNNDKIRAATLQILDFNKNFGEAIPAFLDILKNDQNPTNKKFATIFINSIFNKSYEQIPPEFLGQVRELLCEIIPNEQDSNIRDNEIEIASKINIEGDFGPILSLIPQMLQHEQLLSSSLLFLRRIYANRNETDLTEYFSELLPTIAEQCKSVNDNVKIQAILLLSELSYDDNLQDTIDQSNVVPEILSQLPECISAPETATAMFKLVKAALKNDFDSFAEKHTEFMELATQIMSNSDIDKNIRILAADSVSRIMKVNIDEVEENIADIVGTFLEVSAQMYEEDPASVDYLFPRKLFEALAETGELSIDAENDIFDSIFDMATTFITDESTDEAHINVGLATIMNLLNVVPDLTLNHEEEILTFVQQGLSSEDENIIGSAADIIRTLCESLPDNCSQYINILTPLLLPNIGSFQVQNAMAALFDSSTIPPSNIEEVLQTLVNTLSEANELSKGDLLALVCLALSNATTAADSYYEELSPILVQALDEEDSLLKANAIRCFGIFAKLSPHLIEPNLEQLITTIVQLFDLNDISVNGECCACLSNICVSFPQSLVQYLETLVGKLTEILEQEDINQSPEEEEEKEYAEIQNAFKAASGEDENQKEKFNVFIKMKNAALDTLSLFCSSLPKEMEPLYPQVLAKLEALFSVDDPQTLQSVCDASINITSGMKIIGSDPSQIVDFLIGSLTSEHAPLHEVAAVIWQTIGEIFEIFGKPLIDKYIEIISPVLFSIINPETNKYLYRGDLQPSLHAPIYFTLDTIVKAEGLEYRSAIEQILEAIVSIAQSTKKSHVRANHSLMVIACTYQDPELAQKALQAILSRDINSPNTETQIISLSALTECVHHFCQMIGEVIPSIVEKCLKIFNKMEESGENLTLVETAISLYLSLVLFAGISTTPDQISQMISKILEDQESSEFLYLAEFIVSQKVPISQELLLQAAVIILSSEERYIQKIPQELLREVASIASNAPEDFVISVLKNNQRRIQQYSQILQQFN